MIDLLLLVPWWVYLIAAWPVSWLILRFGVWYTNTSADTLWKNDDDGPPLVVGMILAAPVFALIFLAVALLLPRRLIR